MQIIDLPLEENGFLGTAELAAQLSLHGRRIVEHPATLEVRLFGFSKMKTDSHDLQPSATAVKSRRRKMPRDALTPIHQHDSLTRKDHLSSNCLLFFRKTSP